MRRVRSTVCVGRDAELAALRDGILSGAAGRGACFVVLGEAGAGKSRLLVETARIAAQRGLTCLAANPPRTIVPPAFGVVAAALRCWTRTNGMPQQLLAPFGPGLRWILPEWPAGPEDPELSHDQMRLLALEGAFRLVVHAAGRRGAIVLLDDLQDADPESLAFLHHAAASVSSERVTVVAAVRTPEGQAVAAEARALESRDQGAVLELGPLDPAAVTSAVEEMLGAPAPEELVAEIVRRTGGVPLLVEEMVDGLLASGGVRIEWGRVRWQRERGTEVGATLRELVDEKMRRLDDPARRTLRAAAIVGRFDETVLGPVAEIDASDVSTAIRAAIDVGVLDAAGGQIGFHHALIRDAVVETILPSERAALHRRAAAVLAGWDRADPALLTERAHHLEAVGEVDAAADLLLIDGMRSLAAHAPASAHAGLTHARSLARDRSLRARIMDALAAAAFDLGRWEDALRVDQELLDEEGDTPHRLDRMARASLSAGHLDDAARLIERARGAGADPASLAVTIALLRLWQGRLSEACDAAAAALRQVEGRDDPRLACRALDVLGRAHDALGQRRAAAAFFRRWLDQAASAGLTSEQLQALMELGIHDFLSGGPADRLLEARELATQHAIFVPLVLADLGLLWWYGRRAQVADAIRMGEEAVDVCRRFSLDLLPHALMDLGWAYNLSRWERGGDLVDEALGLAADDVDLVILGAWIRGEAALRGGFVDRASRHLGHAAELMRAEPSSVPTPAPFLWAATEFLAGRFAEAARLTAAARTSPAVPRQYVNQLWLAVDEALVAEDAPAFEQAVATFRASAPFDVAVAQVIAAERLRVSHAAGWLRDALDVFQTGGLEDDAARTRRLMRSLGAPVPRVRRAPSQHPLLVERGVTPREHEVLVLVVQGLTNPQIGERLFVSPRTVQTHVSSLLTKFEVDNRAALIRVAFSTDVVPH